MIRRRERRGRKDFIRKEKGGEKGGKPAEERKPYHEKSTKVPAHYRSHLLPRTHDYGATEKDGNEVAGQFVETKPHQKQGHEK